jgi:folate-binding Fe-S cluster repair protein YgfZ
LTQDNSNGYTALRGGAGLVARARTGLLQLTGRDRRDYLHNLLTNDIASLQPGTGCYAALLTPQGRMISDMRVFELGGRMLIDLPAISPRPSARISIVSCSARTSRSKT